MSETRICEVCRGTGRVLAGAGLDALQREWPDLPIREMAQRGWIDAGDVENVARCEASFLRFWEASSHAEIRDRYGWPQPAPLSSQKTPE